MKIEALAPKGASITDGVRKLVLTAEFPGEELDLARLFRTVKDDGIMGVAMKLYDDTKEPSK